MAILEYLVAFHYDAPGIDPGKGAKVLAEAKDDSRKSEVLTKWAAPDRIGMIDAPSKGRPLLHDRAGGSCMPLPGRDEAPGDSQTRVFYLELPRAPVIMTSAVEVPTAEETP